MSAVRRNLCLSAAGLLLLGVHEAGAHHSAAQFDTRTEVVLEGTVTQFDWRNPHVYTAIEVETDEGERYIQEIEAGASSILLPLGLSPDAVDIGDRISVIAAPNRRGERRIVLGRQMTKADGTVLPLNIAAPSARAPSVAQAESLEGTWFAPRPGFGALLAASRDWGLTEAAEALIAGNAGRPGVHSECIPVTSPTLMVYPVSRTVEVTEEAVTFEIDWMQSRRTVYLDGRGHPENGEPSLHGHSIGHWDGDTLVVDTTLFAEHREGLAFGLPSSTAKHTVERFTLSDDGRHIDYQIVVEDSEHLRAPVTHSSQWEYRPDMEPSGLACELDIARRYLED